jgi:nucleoside diphosphate kinase
MLVCGIIKPHALHRSNEILIALQTDGALVKETRRICYTHKLVEILYDHMSPEARRGIERQLIGLNGLALLLCVPSIEWLLEAAGRESDPSKCESGTIRFRFGVHTTPLCVGEDYWWENAFHRPINAREAARDLLRIFKI